MAMDRWIAVAAVVAALAACSKKKTSEGLPPAQDWNASQAGAEPPDPATTTDPHGGQIDPSNPHGGQIDPSNPHAGVDMNNPHAGVDMSGAGAGDVAAMGLPPPDPNRKIDPTHHISGVISVDPKAKDKVPSGGTIFLSARQADASGQPVGMPLAVAKLTYTGGDLPFELDDGAQMTGATGSLAGDVVVTAHYDQDGNATSKDPGDVLGTLRVKVPADNVKIHLDQIVP